MGLGAAISCRCSLCPGVLVDLADPLPVQSRVPPVHLLSGISLKACFPHHVSGTVQYLCQATPQGGVGEFLTSLISDFLYEFKTEVPEPGSP